MADKKEKSKEKGKGKGKGLTIVIIILLVLILVGGGAFAGWMIFFNKKDTTTNTKAVGTTVNQTAGGNVNGASYVPSDATITLDEFLVNLADDNAKRYLKVQITLGYDTKSSKKMTKELTDKTPILRDTINSVLRSKKSSDFTQKGVEDLKKEIIDRLNIYMENGRFNNVYFNDILVQ